MEMERLAEILEAVKVLHLEPDDTLVFRTSQSLSHEMSERIKAHLRSILGKDRNILIIDSGAEIEIVRPEGPTLTDVVTDRRDR